MFELPIDSKRSDIVQAVRNNQVVIVIGETGSGKTTRIPQFLFQEGFSSSGKIGITEPRRIAAISTAQYIANQLGATMGDTVGYQVRFDDQTKAGTRIKFMTDGILLHEMKGNPHLLGYSVIMIDEAHERSVNIDVLLGLLKRLLSKRRDLKVVIASATIDAQKFSKFFNNAPVINVSGRLFSVDVRYNYRDYFRPEFMEILPDLTTTIAEIHTQYGEGDILVFVSGKDDIDKLIADLERKLLPQPERSDGTIIGAFMYAEQKRLLSEMKHDVVFLPVHGELPPEEQRRIFDEYPGQRKIIVATSVAETSITPTNVKYVVDSGLIKQANFNPETGIRSLDVVEHSQSGCNQRTGRAGRVSDGICFRMYTERNFLQRPQFTKPEIQRISLTDVVLLMKSIGIEEVEAFEFIDPVDSTAFHEAYETLVALGAIKRGVPGLTEIGQAMANLPVDARTARMVLEANRYGCVEEVATIAAFLQVKNVFWRPKEKDKQREADSIHYRFKDHNSDALGFLKLWAEFEASNFDRNWCFENYLNAKSLQEVRKIRSQLFEILSHHDIKITKASSLDLVQKAVVMGLAYNLFEHDYRGNYKSALPNDYRYVSVHPSSSLFFNNQQFIVVTEILETTRVWGRICTKVKPEWLPELLPQQFTFGPKFVINWDAEQGTATVAQQILDRRRNEEGVSVDEIKATVDEAEAIRIQSESMALAQREGWVALTFYRGEMYTWVGYDRFRRAYKLYYAPLMEEGQTWMCRIIGSVGDYEPVTPIFRLFNFSSRSQLQAAR